MDTKNRKLSKTELSLIASANQFIELRDFQKAIDCLKELIKYWRIDPIYYAMLGDCYLGLNNSDKAVENYQLALDYENQHQTYGTKFYQDVEKTMRGEKFCIIAYKAFSNEEYERAIEFISAYIKLEPEWGESYAFRGECYEKAKYLYKALLDYEKAQVYQLPEYWKDWVLQRIPLLIAQLTPQYKPVTLVNTSITKTPQDIANQESIHGFQTRLKNYIRALNQYSQVIAISQDDEPRKYRNIMFEWFDACLRMNVVSIIFGFNKNGMYIVTKDSSGNQLSGNQTINPVLFGSVLDENTGDDIEFVVKPGSRRVRKQKSTLSREKELARKRKYYHNNKPDLSMKQNIYDQKHRAQTKLRNKYYYLIEHHGVSKTYNLEDSYVQDDKSDTRQDISDISKDISGTGQAD